jgi:hypothetical protein
MLKRGFGIAELRDCPWFGITRRDLFDFVTLDDAPAFVTPGEDLHSVTPGEDPGSISLARHGSRIKSGMTASERVRDDGEVKDPNASEVTCPA